MPRKKCRIRKSSAKTNYPERRRRKQILVKMLGGRCKKCGYNKSIKALSFHHIHPEDKEFDISNGNMLKDWKLVLEEVKKCELLCLNCHTELHDKK